MRTTTVIVLLAFVLVACHGAPPPVLEGRSPGSCAEAMPRGQSPCGAR